MSMPKNRLRTSLITALAVGMLPLLAACGGSSDSAADSGSGSGSGTGSGSKAGGGTTKTVDGAAQLGVPDDADDYTKKLYIQENTLAACMKKLGFTYTPHVAAQNNSPVSNVSDGEDYAAAKKSRQKYGFGTYAASVYPNDSDAPGSNARGNAGGKVLDPPNTDQAGFSEAQKAAYDTALNGPPAESKEKEQLGGCTLEAHEAAYGPQKSQAEEKKNWAAREEENRANGLELNGDAELVQLAQKYATCLKGEGIPVSTTQPTGLASMVRLDITTALPEHRPTLTKEEALPLLTKEIAVALKDLECGKDFRAAYFPKEKAHPYWGDGA
ncbi:hypothetical protein [Streptomyces sp. NPDC093109]|uniref:hypothetical protein n=1 Tax=Streptomyces sp. NPDC093109 TaxID=3154977 RepID=UPI00345046DE